MFSVFGVSWGALGRSLTLLGRSWRTLVASLGHSWGAFGRSWDTLGASLDALEALLGASWALLGASWAKYRKNLEGNMFFETILGPKMEAKIIKNRVQKTMRFS